MNNALLQGNLQEQVFMAQPKGYVNPDFPNHVFRLKKAIYGQNKLLMPGMKLSNLT